MREKFLPGPGTCGDGNRARSNCLSAGNVPRSIADDVDLGGIKFVAMLFSSARPREWSQLVAIMMIVGKRSEFEEVPHSVMFQFQLRPSRYVPGEKSQNEM